MNNRKQFHQYQVVGRALPFERDEHPKIYRMKLWATNEVRAKLIQVRVVVEEITSELDLIRNEGYSKTDAQNALT